MWSSKSKLQNCRELEESVKIPHDFRVSYKTTKKLKNIYKIHIFCSIIGIIYLFVDIQD